ncbi:MAG: hypothetical protein CES88_16490 [Halobacteriovorax sp. JY17]|nr:MAG: hypothetical protein CES88_16490 [Halobacteriovorax sp. JY17]
MGWRSFILALFLNFQVHASTFFMPDSDTAALITLVSNTASTVTNTMKILEVAKKASEKVDKYNFLAMRRYFIARRIEQHSRDIIAVGKMDPRGLKEVNQVMFGLKMNLKGLKSNIDFMAMDLFQAENFSNKYWEKIANSMQDENEAHNQELLSASEGSMSKHVQNTAMNTAMTSKVLAKIRRDNIEYQKVDIALKKGSTKEKLRREAFYKNWIGISQSESDLLETEGQL